MPAATMIAPTPSSSSRPSGGKSRCSPATPTSCTALTRQPISSAMTRASSAVGRSDVPALMIPTYPPAGATTDPARRTSAVGQPARRSIATAPGPAASNPAASAAACASVSRLTIARPRPSSSRPTIATTCSGVFPAA